jgi:hypothetical protein
VAGVRDVNGREATLSNGRAGVLRYAALGLAVAALTLPVLRAAGFEGTVDDFDWHARSARRTWQNGRLETPHFLHDLLTIAVRRSKVVSDWNSAGIVVALAFQALLAIVLLRETRRAMPATTPFAGMAAVALTLALMVVTPVTFMSWPHRNLYIGYLGINTFHNPTMYVLRPLALLVWLRLAASLSSEGARAPAPQMAAAAVLSVLCVLAKPSYGIVLLPALAVVGAWRWARGRPIDHKLILLGFAVPTVIVLAWQYAFTFASGTRHALAWAPLAVMSRFHGSAARVALAVIFPATVYLTHWRRALKDAALNLAWLVFAIGVAYAYLLAETGDRAGHGNLTWSGQIAAFVLFVTSTLFALRNAGERGGNLPVVASACAAAFALHFVSGVYFLLHPTWL